jgi:hypothetical protein
MHQDVNMQQVPSLLISEPPYYTSFASSHTACAVSHLWRAGPRGRAVSQFQDPSLVFRFPRLLLGEFVSSILQCTADRAYDRRTFCYGGLISSLVLLRLAISNLSKLHFQEIVDLHWISTRLSYHAWFANSVASLHLGVFIVGLLICNTYSACNHCRGPSSLRYRIATI